MAKTSSITLKDLLALFPALLGIIFIASVAYILYNYENHERIDRYVISQSERERSLDEYTNLYNEFSETLRGIGEDTSLSDRYEILILSQDDNQKLLAIANKALEASSIMFQYQGSKGEDSLVMAYIRLDQKRIELHTLMKTFFKNQLLITDYMKLKDERSTCFSRIDLGSTEYKIQLENLTKCQQVLSLEHRFVNEIDHYDGFKMTDEYLKAYSLYWENISEMFKALTHRDSVLAKQKSDLAGSMIADVNQKAIKSENELNQIFNENPLLKIEEMTKDLNNEVESVKEIESSI